MKKATRRTLLNIVMVAAIVAIIAAGVLAVGNVRGWFGGDDAIVMTQAGGTVRTIEVLSQNKIGSANIERSGVAYSLKDGTKLRDGDIIQTLNGSSVDITCGENTVGFDENSSATVHISDTGEVSIDLDNGGIFANISEPFALRVMDTDVLLESGVFSASAPCGSASVYVFENTVLVGGETVEAGDVASILKDGIHTAALSIQSLNSFDITRVTAANESRTLCFTNAQIEQLAAERETSVQEAAQAQLLEDENAQKVEEQRQENEKKQNEITTSGNTGGNAGGNSGDDTGDNADDDTSGNTGGGTEGSNCTITIRCDTILDNMGDLAEGKNKYVPANGVILATSKLSFEEGETVFDVLKRACSLADIQLEYSWTPMYSSYYIEGINHLYEFDCGNESGWMYKVNGWFPNYGCSAYTLEDGDVIVWCYTCKGLGADVGGAVY